MIERCTHVYTKPIFVGTGILDLSTLCMMQFHYDVIQNKFEGKHIAIYGDTDSLVHKIEDPDIYEWIKVKKNIDLSDSLRHDVKNCDNIEVPGK